MSARQLAVYRGEQELSEGDCVRLIQSQDGTDIAVERTGNGPPLVLVVGAFCDRGTTKPLAALLAPRYTVYEYDRRGRGDSGHGALTIEREVQDLAAVIGLAAEAPFVFGHSSGGCLALETAAGGVPVRSIAVYEPPYTGDAFPGEDFGRRLDEMVESGRRDLAAEEWLAMTGTPAPVIESLKVSPSWSGMLSLAHTLPQDLRLGNRGKVPVERLMGISVPVLAMAGGVSPPWATAVSATIVGALPRAHERIVEGQGHGASPPAVAAVLERFFI